MSAYMIADLNVINQERYESYRVAVREAIGAFGGRHVCRGGTVDVLEGTWHPSRMVIIEFPSMDLAKQFYASPQYEKARAMRQNAAMVNMILVEGLEEIINR